MRPLTGPAQPLTALEQPMTLPSVHPVHPDTLPAASSATGVIAVVAPYGTGKHYRAEVTARGWRCVAVTEPDALLAPMYQGALDPSGYSAVVVHDGDVQETVASLRGHGVTALVAGTEIGVPLAERLAFRLGLPGNSAQTSHLRRDKGAMAAALREAGLDHPRTLATDSLDEALSWARAQPGQDFVLKPADSGGSDGVAFCSTLAEIRSAWKQLHQVPNALGGTNGHLILQERLRGIQYVVNSVSAPGQGGHGRHTFTEFWADHRIGHLYDRLDLLRPHQLIPRALAQYTARALDALGIVTGPAHTEIMYVAGRGPVMIETGARPEGSYPPEAMREVTGSDHIADTVHAVITGRPERLSDRRPEHQFVSKVTLNAPHDGAIDEDLLRVLLALPTVRGHVGKLTPGALVTRTVDLLSSPGRLVLASPNAARITADHATIRSLERSGLYAGVAQ
ncbi:hypothetical protein [Streptomyces sp. NPDC001089]